MPNQGAGNGDVIRIVPLAGPSTVIVAPTAAVTGAQLVYNNGPLIANADVFTIFWGSGWRDPSQSGLIDQINAFFDYILSSALIDQLAEYSVPEYQIGYGQRTGTLTLIILTFQARLMTARFSRCCRIRSPARRFHSRM